MATSDTAIVNLALQKLGTSERITSLTQDHPLARSANVCYEMLRDRELRANVWGFAKKRATLAADATAPAFDFGYAFPLPSDYLRLLSPNVSGVWGSSARNDVDWTIENHQGSPAIMTNDGDTLKIVYIARITDPTQFDALFDEALACKIAWHLAEEVTQSNTKKEAAFREYRLCIGEAKKVNAIEKPPIEPPVDTWISARL